MILLLVPILTFSQYIVPEVENKPILDGRWEDIWKSALEIDLGKEIRKLRILSDGKEFFLLVKLRRNALYYVGRSFYFGVSIGKSCDEFSEEILIPFKIWKGRAYIFEKDEYGSKITGFMGVGLGNYLELSLKGEKGTLCLFILNSRNGEIIERYGLKTTW